MTVFGASAKHAQYTIRKSEGSSQRNKNRAEPLTRSVVAAAMDIADPITPRAGQSFVERMDYSENSSGESSFFATDSDDGFAMNDDRSAAPTNTDGVGQNDVDEVQNMVKKETRNVQRWRCVVIIMLLAAAGFVSTLTYRTLERTSDEAFTSSFALMSETVAAVLHTRFEQVLSDQEVTTARFASKSGWPNVRLDNFEFELPESAAEVRFLPLVAPGATYDATEENGNVLQAFPFNVALLEEGGYERETSGINKESLPYAQVYPPRPSILGYNALNQTWMKEALDAVRIDTKPVFVQYSPFLDDVFRVLDSPVGKPTLQLASVSPVLKRNNLTGVLVTIYKPWTDFFLDGIPLTTPGNESIVAVISNNCNDTSWSCWMKSSGESSLIGQENAYEEHFSQMHSTVLEEFPFALQSTSGCKYSVSLYPTSGLEAQYHKTSTLSVTFVVALTFGVMMFFFTVYERFVQRKNMKVMFAAAQFNKMVSNLIPSSFRSRVFSQGREKPPPTKKMLRKLNKKKSRKRIAETERSSLKAFLNNDALSELNENGGGGGIDDDDCMYAEKPIADLYTDTTILFADIVGFTAWSSVREPSQVFILLETLYRAFDQIAARRKVFKVETVGDCYVAVTGLPDPRADHAVCMARFANDILTKMGTLSRKLEVRLGPDTGDLDMRVGLHSGPVTAGVLRGERSRFQLFGDTMNTASRMESTGKRGKIQVSQESATLLINAGKGRWLTRREDTVHAKGKGELVTYWLATAGAAGASAIDNTEHPDEQPSESHVERKEILTRTQSRLIMNLSGDSSDDDLGSMFTEKTSRLISWNVEVLRRLLKLVVARRNVQNGLAANIQNAIHNRKMSLTGSAEISKGTVLDEVKEVIAFPDFHTDLKNMDPESVSLGEEVDKQLYEYVVSIAAMYRSNPFHNFEHASHVTMSVVKLLSRIVAPEIEGDHKEDHTYGITADPLTQFACVFSALIHDVDHSGVPNSQLIVEKSQFAAAYDNKSVAEQNSVDLAWLLLMDEQYAQLRNVIYETPAEKQRFRQLVVNSVMATDIMDKDLKQLRNNRWDKAFGDNVIIQSPRRPSLLMVSSSQQENIHRKATIVIEHLIQASDVAHTMQHWHIYRKWNERLFQEMRLAYEKGRAEKDPADFWYKGELGFFDFYIIPLAKKLKDCGVFGVSSDEYLNYAQKNRAEWEIRGREVVSEMLGNFRSEHGTTTGVSSACSDAGDSMQHPATP